MIESKYTRRKIKMSDYEKRLWYALFLSIVKKKSAEDSLHAMGL